MGRPAVPMLVYHRYYSPVCWTEASSRGQWPGSGAWRRHVTSKGSGLKSGYANWKECIAYALLLVVLRIKHAFKMFKTALNNNITCNEECLSILLNMNMLS